MIVLKASQERILSVLQSVSGIVERRHTLPILANVLLRKVNSQLQLTTSDLEIQIRTTADLEGDSGNFTTTVGARKLIDILRSMPSEQSVTLESAQNKLILKGGKSRFTLQTLPAEVCISTILKGKSILSSPLYSNRSSSLIVSLVRIVSPPSSWKK